MKKLTAAEERIMHVLWKLENALVRDVLAQLDSQLSYTTVSTTIRILEKKGFVGHNAFGKTHQYFPLISKEKYRREMTSYLVSDYFNHSYRDLVSYFAREEKISADEMEEIIRLIRNGGSDDI